MSERFIILTLNVLTYSSITLVIVFIVLFMITVSNFENNRLYSTERRSFIKPIIFTMVGLSASLFFSLFYLEILKLISHL